MALTPGTPDIPGWVGSAICLANNTDTLPWWSHGYLAMGLLTVVVVLAGIWDYRTQKIPNLLVGPAILLGFLLAGVTGYFGAGWDESGWAGCREGLASAGLAFSIAFVPFFVIWRLGGLGGGDVKLIGAIGAIGAKIDLVIGAAFYGFFIVMLVAFYLMFRHRIFKRTFRRIGNAVLMSSAKVKPDLNADTIHIPLGVPMGIGAILAGLEVLLGLKVPWSLL